MGSTTKTLNTAPSTTPRSKGAPTRVDAFLPQDANRVVPAGARRLAAETATRIDHERRVADTEAASALHAKIAEVRATFPSRLDRDSRSAFTRARGEFMSPGGLHLLGGVEGGAPGTGAAWDAERVPSYDGAQWGSDGGFMFDSWGLAPSWDADFDTGRVHARAVISIRNAGDDSFVQYRQQSQVMVWFHTPRAGRVEIEVHGRRINDFAQYSVTDESGASDFFVRGWTWLMMHVIDARIGDWSQTPLFEFGDENDGDTATGSCGHYADVVPFVARVATTVAVPGDAWRPVRVGVNSITQIGSDDMAVHCAVQRTYVIDRIKLRIAP